LKKELYSFGGKGTNPCSGCPPEATPSADFVGGQRVRNVRDIWQDLMQRSRFEAKRGNRH